MSDLPASKSGPARLVAYPDDEEANIFTTDPLRVYCEHTQGVGGVDVGLLIVRVRHKARGARLRGRKVRHGGSLWI